MGSAWNKNHPEAMRESKRRYRAKIGEKRNEYERGWRARNARQQRDYRLKRKYGITIGQYEAMLAAQGGMCAICKGEAGRRGFHVDHDHATKKVRGLLCHGCNIGLGAFRDDPAALRNAAQYLENV